MGVPTVDLDLAWRPPIAGVSEVLHATHVAHAYPRHAHATWTLFIVDAGAVRYDLGRHERLAAPSMVSLLPPHVAHDGRPATDDGYRMRVLYLDPALIPDALIGPAVDRPFVEDGALRRQLAAAHDSLAGPDGPLEAETRLHLVLERLTAHLAGRPGTPTLDQPRALAEAVRACLDEGLTDGVPLATIARSLGTSPAGAARAFRSTFGLPPYEYVLGRRLEDARARILDGEPIADVAAATGFADQAHLTKRYRRLFGTTPGRSRRAPSQLSKPATAARRPWTARRLEP